MFFDTHSHLSLCQHISLAEHLDLIRKAKIKKIIDPGLSVEDFPARYNLLKKYDEVYLGLAIAPHYLTNQNYQKKLENLEELLKEKKKNKIIALSEIGLDYFHVQEKSLQSKQKEIFLAQLLLAKKYDLPVFLHIRDAFANAYDIVQESGHKQGVLHCFTGTKMDAQRFIDWGFLISFSGIVTFKKSRDLQEIAKTIPLDRIITETDSPYLAPVPFRGEKNNSSYLVEINRFLAKLRNVDFVAFNTQIWKNSCQLIGIKN